MGHLGAVARFVQQHPEWITLLGAQPTEPETEYGWIEAGARVGWTTEGPLYRVFRFWEKPSSEVASTLLVNGCLWNTFVLVAGAGTLVAAGEECVPELNDRLARLSAFFGTEQESWAIGQAYALAPRANFSRAVLEHCPRALAVSKLPPLTWCDLGTPVRVVKTLADLGISPLWLSRLPRPACSESRHCRTCRRRECRTSRAWRWDGVRCLRSAHTLKGVGPTTTRIFLRDLRSIGDLGRAPRVDRRRPSGTIRPFVYSRSRHQISAERG